MHAVELVHDTALRKDPKTEDGGIAGLGLGTIDQAVPFHDSTSV
jgi:hypothetical protein